MRRVLWHVSRVRGQLDRRFFLSLLQMGIVAFVLIAALLITLIEKP